MSRLRIDLEDVTPVPGVTRTDTEPRLVAVPDVMQLDESPRLERCAVAAYEAWRRISVVGRRMREWSRLTGLERERWRVVARTVFAEASR